MFRAVPDPIAARALAVPEAERQVGVRPGAQWAGTVAASQGLASSRGIDRR